MDLCGLLFFALKFDQIKKVYVFFTIHNLLGESHVRNAPLALYISFGVKNCVSATCASAETYHLYCLRPSRKKKKKNFHQRRWPGLTCLETRPKRGDSLTSGQVKNIKKESVRLSLGVSVFTPCLLVLRFGTKRTQVFVRQLALTTWRRSWNSMTGRHKQLLWYADRLLCLFAFVVLSDWWLNLCSCVWDGALSAAHVRL